MSTETYYVVRDDRGWHLSSACRVLSTDPLTFGPEEFEWADGGVEFCNRYGRAEAEAKAAEFGGTAQRVTVAVKDVGLEWEHDPLATHIHRLRDGGKVVAIVCSHSGRCMDHSGPAYSLSPYDNGAEWFEHLTVEQAKAAAEAAVRGTWA